MEIQYVFRRSYYSGEKPTCLSSINISGLKDRNGSSRESLKSDRGKVFISHFVFINGLLLNRDVSKEDTFFSNKIWYNRRIGAQVYVALTKIKSILLFYVLKKMLKK